MYSPSNEILHLNVMEVNERHLLAMEVHGQLLLGKYKHFLLFCQIPLYS